MIKGRLARQEQHLTRRPGQGLLLLGQAQVPGYLLAPDALDNKEKPLFVRISSLKWFLTYTGTEISWYCKNKAFCLIQDKYQLFVLENK